MAGTTTLKAVRDYGIEPDSNGRLQIFYGKIQVTAGGSNTDYAAGGLTLDLTSVFGPFAKSPVEVKIWSDAVANGFIFRYIPDAAPTIANGKVAIFQGTATAVPFAQITGTLPAAIGATTADTVGALRFKAVFVHGK